MKPFLKKLQLIQTFQISLPIRKTDFITRLSAITDPGDTGIFMSSLDIFSSGRNEFRGHVDSHGFKIQRKKRLFDINTHLAVASGSCSEVNGNLQVDVEINGLSNFFIVFYIFLIIVYSIFFGLFIHAANQDFIAIPFLLLHAAIMFGFPYLMMRRSVKRLKYDLEREFYYLTKEE